MRSVRILQQWGTIQSSQCPVCSILNLTDNPHCRSTFHCSFLSTISQFKHKKHAWFFKKSSVDKVQIPANAKLENDTGWLKKAKPSSFVSLFALSACITGRITTVHTTKKKANMQWKFLARVKAGGVEISDKAQSHCSDHAPWVEAPTGTAGLWGGGGVNFPPKKVIRATKNSTLVLEPKNSLAQHCWQCLRCEATSTRQLSALKLNYFSRYSSSKILQWGPCQPLFNVLKKLIQQCRRLSWFLLKNSYWNPPSGGLIVALLENWWQNVVEYNPLIKSISCFFLLQFTVDASLLVAAEANFSVVLQWTKAFTSVIIFMSYHGNRDRSIHTNY